MPVTDYSRKTLRKMAGPEGSEPLESGAGLKDAEPSKKADGEEGNLEGGGVVALGVSGGVDSSVAALLLKRAGRRLVGVSHRVWSSSTNPHVVAEKRAEEVCRRLDIPFFSIDISKDFRERVIDDFLVRYKEGLTPNPCVLCNEQIKFGLFPRLVRERLMKEGLLEPKEPLFTATGHYVKLKRRGKEGREGEEGEGEVLLQKGDDRLKDQSYMLYRVAPEILRRCIFPLGGYKKSEVIKIAEKEKLPSAGVGESQDICFIEGDYIDYIEEHLGIKGEPGPIVDSLGRELGTHRGYMRYTVGQRQGLGLSNGPWYVASLDAASNTVLVKRRDELGIERFTVGGFTLMISRPEEFEAEVMVRYNSRSLPCRVKVQGTEAQHAEVFLSEPAVITPGQSAVLYDGETVVGGGFILPPESK
ncbi:MAG: tRNA 2-thiouridine(34) synthase MnmA [Spirochaetia bacterium]